MKDWLVGEHTVLSTLWPSHMGKVMDAKTRFAALETMCRERARLAESDLKYWLEEAEEWARFKKAEEAPIDSLCFNSKC
jgi:hypothetical protein